MGHVLVALLGAAPAHAQVPVLSSFSVGMARSEQWVAEPGDRGHAGSGIGLRFGFTIAPRLALEGKVRTSNHRHANLAAEYGVWEASAGVRYHIPSGYRRLVAYAEGYGLVQATRMDRAGITPGPEALGHGGGMGGGIRLGVLPGIWAELGGDLASTWFSLGRVENGNWIAMGDASVRTTTRRISAGVSWYP